MQEDLNNAKQTLKYVIEQLKGRFPKAAQTVMDAEEDILEYMSFPEKHWKHIYSSNLIERLNKEIRRRFNVVSVFPDRSSVICLGGAILIEQNDEWNVAERRYLSKKSIDELMLKMHLKSCRMQTKCNNMRNKRLCRESLLTIRGPHMLGSQARQLNAPGMEVPQLHESIWEMLVVNRTVE